MADIEQHEIPFKAEAHRNPKSAARNFSVAEPVHVRKSVVRILRCGGLAGGRPGTISTTRRKPSDLAILFDSLDGRVARMTGTNTEFGVQFDSLADVVSFGVAPAVMAYAWGVRSVHQHRGEGSAQQLVSFAWGCCLAVSDLLRMEAGAV